MSSLKVHFVQMSLKIKKKKSTEWGNNSSDVISKIMYCVAGIFIEVSMLTSYICT